jgi:hypothetical protein
MNTSAFFSSRFTRFFSLLAVIVSYLAPVEAPACDSPVCQQETADLATLLAPAAATHRAVASGDWSSAATWQGGAVPGAGATVFIPAGIDVRYDLSASPRLDTVRVEGALRFATDRSTRLVLDTLFLPVNSAQLDIGTPVAPIPAQFTAEVVITGDRRDGAGNTVFAAADTKQFGRGLVSKGIVRIHGAKKDAFHELVGDAPAGSRTLTLRRAPEGWRVGDRLVLAGTHVLDFRKPQGGLAGVPYPGWYAEIASNNIYQDEELEITAINGAQISFVNLGLTGTDRGRLRFDHTRPSGLTAPSGVSNDLAIHLGNLTRNVVIRSESGQDLTLTEALARRNEIWKRGHAMFMHNTNVDILYAAFLGLGRTDKHFDLDEVGTNLDGRTGTGTNQRGRYGVHFHRTGTLDWMGIPSKIQGCVVAGSPGWGIAHHDAHLNVEDNVIYDILGTAVMQEAGNEIGSWRRNLSIKTYGAAPNVSPNQIGPGQAVYDTNSPRIKNFDYGWEGVGFWLHGAGQIVGEDNIAAGAANAGFSLFGNADGGLEFRPIAQIDTRLLPTPLRQITRDNNNPAQAADPAKVEVSAVPLRQLKRLVAYNTNHLYHVWGHLRKNIGQLDYLAPAATNIPFGEVKSVVEDFLGWEIREVALRVEYSSSYRFRDGLLAGTRFNNTGMRYSINKMNGHSVDFQNIVTDGFNSSTYLALDPDPALGRDHIGMEFRDVVMRVSKLPVFITYGTQFGAYTRFINTTFVVPSSPNPPPTATFSDSAVGGLAVRFDASASASNPPETSEAGKGIVAYGWDFDGDGKDDKFGRVVHHYFPAANVYPVRLRVWDFNAVATTVTRNITVSAQPYPSPFKNGDFSTTTNIRGSSFFLSRDDSPPFTWLSYRDNPVVSGALRIDSSFLGGVAQIAPDNRMRRGAHTLSLRAQTTGPARVDVRLFGINGEFKHFNLPFVSRNIARGDAEPDITAAGIVPFEKTLLVNANIGGQAPAWKTFSWDINLGTGYDYLVVQVSANDPFSSSDIRIDDVSLVGTGAPVALPVAPNLPPDITIDLPARSSPRLEIVADVRDDDGQVVKVEFFDGATKIGEDSSAPFAWTVFDATPGMHEYSAVATDNLGATGRTPERYTQIVPGLDGGGTPAVPPAAPTGLGATAVSGERVNLAWTDASSDETGFEVERRLLPDGAFAFLASVPANTTAYADTGLPSGTAFAYRVRALGAQAPSAFTTAVSATTFAVADAPVLSPAPGLYGALPTITLTSSAPAAVIRYTLDGTTPTATTGTLYTGPFALTRALTVRAIATLDGQPPSNVTVGRYRLLDTSPAASTTLFGDTAATGTTFNDSNYELGMRFTTSQSGFITALRVWRPVNGPSTYTARLWTATGTLLATTASFAAPSGAGWAEAALATPVAVTAGANYVVSYSVPVGARYQSQSGGLAATVTSGPLSTVTGSGNGIFITTQGAFPTDSFNNTNYYADVRFVPAPPAEPYVQWREQAFSSTLQGNPALVAEDADPDGDGLSNLLEYALGSSPVAADADSPGRPLSQLIEGRLALDFPRSPARTDLDLVVEASADLVTWTPIARSLAGGTTVPLIPADQVVVSETGSAPVRVTVVHLAHGGRAFLRLRVIKN